MSFYNRIRAFAFLCILGCAMLFPGCTKENDNQSDSENLQFSAISLEDTKAVYGDDTSTGSYQRIIWQGGDDVRIASDICQTALGYYTSDYSVAPMSKTSNAHKGAISHKPSYVGNTEDSGLRWPDGVTEKANFWSVYPASAMDESNTSQITSSIPSSTTLGIAAVKRPSGSVVKVLDPVNGSYPMVSYVSGVNAGTSLVKLVYYPAFTAFQVTLANNTGGDITLANCAISSTTSALSGSFTASIAKLAKDSPTTSSVSVSRPGYKVTAGINQVLTDGQAVTFSIFCLPKDITDATFECTYTDDSGTKTKKLALNRDGQPINFAACKQHRINLDLNVSGQIDYEITPVIAVILSNAFPDQYDYYNGEVRDKDGNPVDLEELQQAILNVRHVVITDDHAVSAINYVSGMYAFVNLESLIIEESHTASSVSVEGLEHFKTLEILQASNLHDVTVSNCPLTESVTINSQSLQTVTFNNLDSLKVIRVGEGTANSNLKTFNLTNCPDLEEAYFGQVGALKNLDMSGSTKLKTLEVALAYQLQNLDLSDCSSLQSIYINNAQSLPSLDVSDCTNLETIEIVDAQKLQSLIIHDKPHLRSVRITSSSPKIEIVELVNLPVLSDLVFPPSAVLRYTMTNCDSMSEVNLSNVTKLSTLELSGNDALESIVLSDPTSLTSFNYTSTILKTLKFNGGQGSSNLATLALNTPALTTLELTNTHKLENVSLSNLPSAFSDISVFVPTNYNATRVVSLTNCSGFTNIVMNPASSIQEIHFDSCANLTSVTLQACNNCNVYVDPPTSNVVATKHNCPNLGDTYTIDNWGTAKQFAFTNQ